MSIASDLIQLQEIDMNLARNRATLENMPGVADLAKKRSVYKKLQRDIKKLYAQRKDAQIDVDDFDEKLAITQTSASQCRARLKDLTESREIRDAEIELSDYSKRIDKISHLREAAQIRLDDLSQKEEYLKNYTAKFGASILKDAGLIKSQATKLSVDIDDLEASRSALRNHMDKDAVQAYDDAQKELGTLAVEQLVDNKPTVCRISLSPSSMADLKHSQITRCPYCHRILVLQDDEAE